MTPRTLSVPPAVDPVAVGGPSAGDGESLARQSGGHGQPVVDPAAHVAVGFIGHRPWPAEWERRLREVSPKPENPVHSWLCGVWEPGEPWSEEFFWQRWVLYDMQHPLHTDPDIVAQLEGPHPRSEGHYCSASAPSGLHCLCDLKFEGWRGSPTPDITPTQWRLYRETGYVGWPFWVIQGTRGGHKVAFSSQEKAFLQMAGKPTEPPPPGALEYADFDERTIAQIIRWNKLRQFNESLRDFKKAQSPEEYRARAAEHEKALRQQLVDFLDEQMADVAELFIRAADTGELGRTRPTAIDYDRLTPQAIERYVETGHLLHHTRMR